MKLARKRKRPRVEMLPLLDIVFLLLVFFIYAMLSMALHRALPLSLPQSATAAIELEVCFALTVMADGSLYLDREPVQLADLAEVLRARGAMEKERRAAAGGEPFVQVFAESSLSYQALYRVLDQVKLSGLSKITLQATAAGEPPNGGEGGGNDGGSE